VTGSVPPDRSTLRKRALRLRCPWCGGGELFRGALAMHERCTACGLKFEREPGYFLGSIYVNYGAAVVVAIGLHLVLSTSLGWSAPAELAVILPVVVALGFLLFRVARALWLAFDLSFDPPEPHEFAARAPGSDGGRGPAPGP
jgi:uncharacterized protein (DUF983 family)